MGRAAVLGLQPQGCAMSRGGGTRCAPNSTPHSHHHLRDNLIVGSTPLGPPAVQHAWEDKGLPTPTGQSAGTRSWGVGVAQGQPGSQGAGGHKASARDAPQHQPSRDGACDPSSPNEVRFWHPGLELLEPFLLYCRTPKEEGVEMVVGSLGTPFWVGAGLSHKGNM